MITLRDYQETFIQGIRDSMRRGNRRVVGVLPTGGGKTVIAAFIAKEVQSRGQSCWFLCHRDFLLTQTAGTFKECGLSVGVIKSGGKFNCIYPVQVAMIDTLWRRLNKVECPDVIIWDETHHIRASTWMKIFNWASQSRHIGLTATPERLDGKGLQPPYTDMVIGPTTEELITRGMLSDFRAFVGVKPNMAGVDEIAGDYNQKQMIEAVEKSAILGDIVKTYIEKAPGTKAVYFCPSLEYSKNLARQFCESGIIAEHLDGESSTKERISHAQMFARGNTKILTNVGLFGEGFDLAAQAGVRDVTIDCVGLVRPTQSLTLHRQQIGRALRPKDYPALILDHAGNIERHGLPTDHIEWSLLGAKPREKAEVKVCPSCGFANKPGTRICAHCGENMKEEGNKKLGPEEIKEAEMVELDRERHRKEWLRKKEEEARCQTYEDFLAIAITRGYSPKWAGIQWSRAKAKVESQAKAYLRDYR